MEKSAHTPHLFPNAEFAMWLPPLLVLFSYNISPPFHLDEQEAIGGLLKDNCLEALLLSVDTGRDTELFFCPILLPSPRGIRQTLYSRPAGCPLSPPSRPRVGRRVPVNAGEMRESVVGPVLVAVQLPLIFFWLRRRLLGDGREPFSDL